MLLDQPGGADALEYDCRPGQSAFGANLPERVERRLLGGIDDDVRAEAITGQREQYVC